MLNDNNSFNQDTRNLSDIFKELQNNNVQNSNPLNSSNIKDKQSSKKIKWEARPNNSSKNNDLKLPHIIIGCSILVVGIAIFFPKNISSKQSFAAETSVAAMSEFELNRHRLNIQNIISENADINRVKEQVVEARDVEFETTYNNTPTLPKGEEVIVQEGSLGKDNYTVVKTFENGDFLEEIILSKEKLQDPVPKIINLGTSEFLAKHRIHIGDIIYLVNDGLLKESTDDSSNDVAEIKKSLDVKLIDLPNEEWCRVSFDNIEGYIKTSNLTSTYTTPNIVEKNRIQRILLKVNKDMALNKTSGLTLNDYKKIFSGLPNDTNNIFEDNYTVFYNIEKKYNINGIFLASIAIHESGWGTSQIAKDKHNLFGYGSYDETPYASSFEFETYAECIETVAKSLVKYYINPSGTIIYDGEIASAWYYNGPTLLGVNTRYASDSSWHEKVYNYMEMLYNRLQ